jgi:hypothetical protein
MNLIEQEIANSLQSLETGEARFIQGNKIVTQSDIDLADMEAQQALEAQQVNPSMMAEGQSVSSGPAAEPTPIPGIGTGAQAFGGVEDQTNIEAIAGPVEEMTVGEFGETVGLMATGAIGGAATATLGLPGDVVAIVEGIVKASGAEEGEGLNAFLQGMGRVSEQYGSAATTKMLYDFVDGLDITDEAKEKIKTGSSMLGEWAEIPGVVPAAQAFMAGVRKTGGYIAGAEGRVAERGTQLMSGVDPQAALDEAIVGVKKLLGRSETIPEVRAEGGLPIAPEKGAENLRLHTQRMQSTLEKGKPYPGAPKNPRTVIPAPEGSGLPDITVGNITPQDWQNRIESTLSPQEISNYSEWYKKVFGEFQRLTNGDPEEMARLTDAWFAGQQNSSPSQTLNDVLFIYEQIKRGVPKEELKGKGLPSANKIVIDILTESEITGGAGQKIADFLDSGYQKNVRSIMGNAPEGGAPFVVDIHTGRDTGLVDPIFINHLKRLGYDVPEDLQIDFTSGISGPMYESRAMFGQQLTDHLNAQGWMGRSDWEPAEIQAIGWMQLSNMYGTSNVGGDITDAFARNTRRISMEVDPGAGSPWAEKFGDDYGTLDAETKVQINDEVTARAIELVNDQMGISLGQTVHGTGGWELYTNPSTVQQAIASKDAAIEAGARLGYLLQQTEVWVNAPKTLTKNPKNFAVDIIETSGENLRDGSALGDLFQRLIDEDPNGLFRGYQPIVIDGKPGIRILITQDAIKESPLSAAKAKEYIVDFANNKLGKITDDLQFDAEIDIMEADLTQLRNDWTEDKTGGGYKNYFGGQAGQDEGAGLGAVLDRDSRELEELFRTKIEQAKAGTNRQVNTGSPDSGMEGAQ